MTYESWLLQINTDTLMDYTNEQIISLPIELCPVDWFNPWLLTEQEIDTMRQDFKGGFKKWAEYVKNNLPQLDPAKEAKIKWETNKSRDIRMCGTISKVRINPLTKQLKKEVWHCKRRDCPKCKVRKEEDLRSRLCKMVGQSYLILDNEKEVEKLLRDNQIKNYFRKVTEDGKVLLIADKPIGETFTLKMAKDFATLPPKGTNMSGHLGKDAIVAVEATSKEVIVSCAEYLIDATPDELKEVEEEYQQEVESIEAKTMEDIQSLVYRCEDILELILERRQVKVFFLYRTKTIVNEKDFIKYASIKPPIST